MTIRQMRSDEVAKMAPGGRAFAASLDWPFDEAGYLAYFKQLVDSGVGVVFFLEDGDSVVGGIGGTIQKEPISGRTVAIESFWYVFPDFRRGMGPIRLLQAFEHWGFAQGAHHVCMIAMAKSMADEIDRLYARLGYSKLETTYIK